MKGVILAGGTGSRLLPLTAVTNKHLLPVYNQPMIHFPLQFLRLSGIIDVMVVTGGEWAGDFLKLLGNGRKFGLNSLTYAYQEGSGGIADALRQAEKFAAGDRICVILGDNLFEFAMPHQVSQFSNQRSGAMVVLKEVPDPSRFGVASLDPTSGKIVKIVEKPQAPESNKAVTGAYFYDNEVFDFIKELMPSGRGELEITDVNNRYLELGTLTFSMAPGWWSDAGTFDSLLHASNLVALNGANKLLER